MSTVQLRSDLLRNTSFPLTKAIDSSRRIKIINANAKKQHTLAIYFSAPQKTCLKTAPLSQSVKVYKI